MLILFVSNPLYSAMEHLLFVLSSRLAPPVLGSGLGVTLPHFPHSSGLEQTRPDLAASDIARSEQAEIKIPPITWVLSAPWPVAWPCQGIYPPQHSGWHSVISRVSVLSRSGGHLFQTESTLAPWSPSVSSDSCSISALKRRIKKPD